MARDNSIAPFPEHIDRESFGHWLSGFADGEAHFCLRFVNLASKKFSQPYAMFRIAIRDDDSEIIGLIQRYFQCGFITRSNNVRSKVKNARPYISFQVSGGIQLSKIIVPHFGRFPLRSKKARDFAIWRQGVEWIAGVAERPDHYRRVANGQRTPKWTSEEREHFQCLVNELIAQRKYQTMPHLLT